jgi:hypothetical protein
MSSDQVVSDYTNRDYASLLASLLDQAAIRLPEWTDRSENDLGRLLVELFAYVGDVLLYYQDRIASEAFLATAVERRSVIDLLTLIGYTLATPSPASADLKICVANDAATPIRVDVGARFATVAQPDQPAVDFIYLPVTDVPLEIFRDGGGGFVEFQISVVNANRVENQVLGNSSGDQNQAFRLRQSPVLLPRDPDSQENLRIEVDAGSGYQVWGKRGTLLYSQSADDHFTVTVNEHDEADVVFGDGTYGRIPPAGSTIRGSYLTGGGAAGNVGAGTITVVKSGVNVNVEQCSNPLAAAGGADRESIEHARRQAPLVYRSRQRAVTAADFAALAQNVPGIGRAVAVAPSWNYVDLYAVDSAGSRLTDELRATLIRYFEERRMVTTLVSPRDPVFVSIHLEVNVQVEPTFYRQDVQLRVEQSLRSLFHVNRREFGQSFYLSRVFEAVEAVAGVEAALVTTFSGERSDPPGEPTSPDEAATGLIQLRDREFPRLGTLTVNVTGGLG